MATPRAITTRYLVPPRLVSVSSTSVDHGVACRLPQLATALSHRASPAFWSTMSKTTPTASAVTNAIKRATASISPPITRRSIARAVSASRGWWASHRTSQRSSAAGSAGSGVDGDRDTAHTRAATASAVSRTASVTGMLRRPCSVGALESLSGRRDHAEHAVGDEPDRCQRHDERTDRGLRHLAKRAIEAFGLRGAELDGGSDQEPSNEPHHDAPTDPPDPAHGHDRLLTQRSDALRHELVTEGCPNPLDHEVDAGADHADADRPDEPPTARQAQDVAREALDPAVLGVRAFGVARVERERQRGPGEQRVGPRADQVGSASEPGLGRAVRRQQHGDEPPDDVQRQPDGDDP